MGQRGIHPHGLNELKEYLIADLMIQLSSVIKKVVAIGECWIIFRMMGDNHG
jgi:hypothetical protein